MSRRLVNVMDTVPEGLVGRIEEALRTAGKACGQLAIMLARRRLSLGTIAACRQCLLAAAALLVVEGADVAHEEDDDVAGAQT